MAKALRADITGLRAVAVLAVTLYHLAHVLLPDVKWFHGGFLGVDIFFVISGYLMTMIIMQGLERALARDFRFRVDRYTPQAATWLTDRGWEDDYPPLPSLKSADSTQRGGASGTAGTEATRERLGNFDTWDFFRNALARSERAFRAGTDAQGNR